MAIKYRKTVLIFVWVLFITLVTLFLSAEDFEKSLIQDMTWRNIGPANTNGRISDIEALDKDFTKVVVASASGGVWKSENAGTTWEPIFDYYGSASIGDVAIFQKNPEIIWVGTGEKNCRNSIAWGDGIYKSVNGGKSFSHMGLKDTHCIAKVLTHPLDPDLVYAAAAGHTWGYSGDRGLFMTPDGGKTWIKLTNGLPDDGKTGAIDLVMHPINPKILYVSFWQRLRQPHRFDSGGPNGGIFKTEDGGVTWKKLYKGLPEGDTGRIGLAISRSQPNVLMTIVEHGFQPEKKLSNGELNAEYSDMSKLGTGIYRTEDNGETWTFMNRRNDRPFYYSHIYINPFDDQHVYVLDMDFVESEDGGKTFSEIGTNAYRRGNTPRGIHGDSHVLWLDPTYEKRFYIGDDGGVALTHDHEKFIFFDNFVISQFYAITADMRDPYYLYGGLQDHATWGGPSRSRDRGILTDHWFRIYGGDGFHVQVDPSDWRTLYFESQEGHVSRMNVETRESNYIRPRKGNIMNYDDWVTKELLKKQKEKGWGKNPFRFNWSTPIMLSPHNPEIIYLGSNYLFKSIDQGDNWMIISPDLSGNDPLRTRKESGGLTSDTSGAENHCTIVTISESPLFPGVIWAGTDDGNVQLTRNGGVTWNNLTSNIKGIPAHLWVSRVEASHFEEGKAYVSFDGHRSDNFKPWIYKTNDYGKNWKKISNNIPDHEPVYVVKEDLKNKELLFAGTEFSVYFSINNGKTWAKLNKNMPTVATHDLLIHPRDGDLIAGTHGRGIWVMDNITPLQQLTREVLQKEIYLFQNRTTTKWEKIRRGGNRGHLYFEAPNPPDDAIISYYLKESLQDTLKIEISNAIGDLKKTDFLKGEQGINRYYWDLHFDPTHQQCKSLIKRLKKEIKKKLGKALPPKISLLKNLLEQLKEAGTDSVKLIGINRKFQQATKGETPRRWRRDFKGPMAEPGTYIIKIIHNDKILRGELKIREDPLLTKRKFFQLPDSG
jgi:photosystem II stability/assembly factor-like uncharacterized protein